MMNTQITTELFHSYPFTTAEAAKLLGVRPQHLASWRHTGFFEEVTHYIRSSWDNTFFYWWNVKATSERLSAANNSGFLPGTKEYFLILKYGEDYYHPH